MGIEAQRHECLFGFRLTHDLLCGGRVDVRCDLEHLVDNDRLRAELDLNHAFRAEQLDEPHLVAEARTVRRAFCGIAEVLGPHCMTP